MVIATKEILFMKKTYVVSIVIGIVIAALVVFGPLSSSPSDKDAVLSEMKPGGRGVFPGTLVVGHLVALDMAPLFIAKELKYFEKEGLNVETRFFSNPGDNNAALASGSLHLTVNPFTLPYLGRSSGSDMKFVAAAGGVGVIEVIAQEALEVSNFDELVKTSRSGKRIRIGSLKGDTLDVVVYRALLDRGSSYDDFEMVWFNDLLAMVHAFQAKEIDVLSHIKPYTTSLISRHGAVSLGTNSDVWGVGTPNCVTMVMSEFASRYPGSVEAYLSAIAQAYQYILDNPGKAAEILERGKYYQVERDVLAAAIQSMPRKVILRPNMEGVNTAIADLVSLGYMRRVSGVIYDSRFLDSIGQKW